ncbi:MAG: hypothetical protein IJ840_02670 [Bacteroidales bacterium]|nr:hypothetical protein [Bacteroidales bacterium]
MGTIGNPVFCALVVFFTLLFLLNLKSFLKIIPSLWDCVVRWKGNLDLENSIQLCRSRNWIAAILFLPMCMLVYAFGLYTPGFVVNLPPSLQLAAVAGVFLVYLALRTFLNWQLEMHNYGTSVFTAANRSFYNYCIILFFLLFLSGGVLSVVFRDGRLVRTIMLWETGLTYAVYIFRRGQIFASCRDPFSTFLYLCSLELLPTAALVISANLL